MEGARAKRTVPRPAVAGGETAGIPSGRTVGKFDVSEFYVELNAPLLADVAGADYLEANLAARTSDYSTFGSESTYKASALWRPIADLSFRASFSTGFRAPGIGELFGGAAREDFAFLDPCADYTAILGSGAGGRDVPQPANIQANCAGLGVPAGLAQTNPQLSAISAGNPDLTPEESDNWTAGIVWQPSWSEGADWTDGITVSVDFYNLEIENAIQGRDPGAILVACAETADPFFCDLTPRSASGQLEIVNNQLQNIGGIDASGVDIMIDYLSPDTSIGQFSVRLDATHLGEYTERTRNPDGSVSESDLTGIHTDETFPRAFPKLRLNTTIGWMRDRWTGSMVFRWTDDMTVDNGNPLDSALFADLRASYNPAILDDSLTITLGFKNIFDEDPPVCDPCQAVGLSLVSHDLPGRYGYLRVSYEL